MFDKTDTGYINKSLISLICFGLTAILAVNLEGQLKTQIMIAGLIFPIIDAYYMSKLCFKTYKDCKRGRKKAL